MYCKNCGKSLDNNDCSCTNPGNRKVITNKLKEDNISSMITNNQKQKTINKDVNIEKNNKIFNIICKILLIFNFLFIIKGVLDGEIFMIFHSVMLIITTIGILKTEQKKNNIFFILGIIALILAVALPIIIMFGNVFIISFIKLLGGLKDLSILYVILKTPEIILNIKGGIPSLITLIIIGISFIIIHKKQKQKK